MELSGGQIVVQCLKDEGVEYLFGYPGGAVLHLYDAIFHQEEVKHILVRHEQAATHAADAYARATGKPGVVLVTSGPGATNAVTGIATAYMDSIPMIVISGQVPTAVIGSDAFQEVDMVGITRPCVKHNFLVKDVNDIAETMKKAFYVATTGRPGPVVIDIPKDITDPNILVPYKYPKKIKMRSYSPATKGHPRQIKKAIDLLLNAKRPVIYSGGGVVLGEASEELRELTRSLNFPITQTLMGLGAYPASDKQFIGMLGMHGTYESNLTMHESDVILAIGVRFDDRVTGKLAEFCPHATIIHIDIDPASISKTVKVDVPIVGDVKIVLKQMLELLKEQKKKPSKNALEAWWSRIDQWRSINCLEFDRDSELIKPQAVIEQLHEVTKGDAFITSDVGQHQMFAAQFYPFDKPRRWINSGGLGTMGFGLPAAIGVKLAHPEADVACVTGEASIQMCIQELSTALQYNTAIKIINLNNRYMGMVRQWQEFSYESRYSQSYMDTIPDFVKLAEAYGHVGIRVEKPEDVKPALEKAFAMKDRTVFLDILTDRTENVYPMIESGKGHQEMTLRVAPGTPINRELA
ncbi:acetolactate synthase 3 large subunit [methanotrophic endosymbiont of Bathymodiolus puteoserpentis (Logatchev)]|uniref:acetolactate synthase 3 large subunit n=1 Tax=methanotrophic endosymbiont of Bathymodiolus puteoserpentis (Logatchev) TaxID=343235 RepID=UPI0013C9702F|nr:acetolactate synthase 3 large subunit [methanotrophic endosymbiont of Bathymodiolus puteoserpentis (Logatchev)]SHE22164.1 Acetolactate synthase large subunit [methanotrophic endosymbiont of Bathymodiolus puteoserpentis (Logatchev)]